MLIRITYLIVSPTQNGNQPVAKKQRKLSTDGTSKQKKKVCFKCTMYVCMHQLSDFCWGWLCVYTHEKLITWIIFTWSYPSICVLLQWCVALFVASRVLISSLFRRRNLLKKQLAGLVVIQCTCTEVYVRTCVGNIP